VAHERKTDDKKIKYRYKCGECGNRLNIPMSCRGVPTPDREGAPLCPNLDYHHKNPVRMVGR
jgi:hypothetical protein